MTLRFLVLLTLFFYFTHGLGAQTTTAYTQLAERLRAYGQKTMDWDIEGMLDMTVPELFSYVPREVLRTQMNSLRSDENMTVHFKDFTAGKIGPVVQYQSKSFAPITCRYRVVFELHSPEYRAPPFVEQMLQMLRQSYGNARYLSDRMVIVTETDKKMYAIRPADTAVWYFAEYRIDNAVLMDLLVPPVVREQME